MAESVKRSVKFDPTLAGAIRAWAEGAGVDFSEAVRRLCSQGLSTWPGSPFAAPAGSSREVINEIRRAKSEAVTELRIAFEDAVDDLIAGRGGA